MVSNVVKESFKKEISSKAYRFITFEENRAKRGFPFLPENEKIFFQFTWLFENRSDVKVGLLRFKELHV